MTTRACQKIYTKIDNITKATVTLRAQGVGNDEDVYKRQAQLIQEDRFYTEEEQDRFDDIDPIAIREALGERGIVNGQVAC